MPTNVFGNSSSSHDNDKKDYTSLFVQKPYLRTNYKESKIQEDIDFKNQYRIKKIPDPNIIREVASKICVDNLFNDASIIKETAHIDLNNKNINNARFSQVNQLTQIDSRLTAKLYVDNAVDELSLVRNNQDNDFNIYNLTNMNNTTLNTQAINVNHVITKTYVDQFDNDSERNRKD